jgi:arylformamidase
MKYIWLSHIIEENMPLYGGGREVVIRNQRSIAAGDSCNTSIISMPSHAGSHVDAPHHFIPGGKSIDDYSPEAWIFDRPRLFDIPVEPGSLIGRDALPRPSESDCEIDMIVLRTGFERFRREDIFWQDAPGLGIDFAEGLLEQYTNLRAIGTDCISIASLKHRDEGRMAHRTLLGEGVLLFEDISLDAIARGATLKQVLALPLRIKRGDGAPCTLIGVLE